MALPNMNLDAMTADERLLLLEILAGKILEDKPDSLIAAQILYNSQYLNGNAPQRKQHRHERGMK